MKRVEADAKRRRRSRGAFLRAARSKASMDASFTIVNATDPSMARLHDEEAAATVENAAPNVPPLKLDLPTCTAPPVIKTAPLRAKPEFAGFLESGDDTDSNTSSTKSSPRGTITSNISSVDCTTPVDSLTPRLLEALASLDDGLSNLSSAKPSPRGGPNDDDAEPEWLTEAAEKAEKVTAEVTSASDSRAAVAALARELTVSEANCAHLRQSAEAQASTNKEIMSQLELTKTAAESTAAAARKIVDDHEKDVAMLLAELRACADPATVERLESKLSAPSHALAARKRQAKAKHQEAKRAASPQKGARPGFKSSRQCGGSSAEGGRAPGHEDPSWLGDILTTASEVGREAKGVLGEAVRAVRSSSPFRGRAGSPFRGRPVPLD